MNCCIYQRYTTLFRPAENLSYIIRKIQKELHPLVDGTISSKLVGWLYGEPPKAFKRLLLRNPSPLSGTILPSRLASAGHLLADSQQQTAS